MKGEIDDALEEGILTPASKLRLTEEEDDSFKKGFVFEKTPEILSMGHAVMLVNARAEKVKERQEFSNAIFIKLFISDTRSPWRALLVVFDLCSPFTINCTLAYLTQQMFENKNKVCLWVWC